MPISLSGSLNLSGSLTTTGTITATTLVVQTITSSISSITGSTNFGSLADNTHTFTGSINASGSANFSSSITATGTINAIGTSPLFRNTDNSVGNVFDVLWSVGGSYWAYGVAGFYDATNSQKYDEYKGGASGFRKLYTNGTLALTIASTGNVGIGTSSPNIGGYGANGRILTIQGVSGSYGILELTSNSANADGNAIGRLDFGSDGQAANYKAISSIASFLTGSTSTKFGADLRFYTRVDNAVSGDPSERMRITSGGNVLIGTTTDADYATLQVQQTYNSGYGGIRLTNTTGTWWTTAISAGGNYYFNYQGSGVGYITSAGAATFSSTITAGVITGDSLSTGVASIIAKVGGGGNNGTYGFGNNTDYLIKGGSDFGNMQFVAGGSGNTRITIQGSTGDVYIGTTTLNKDGRLVVYGETTNSSFFALRCYSVGSDILFGVRNDGIINTGLFTNSPYNFSLSGRDCYINSSGELGYLSSVRESKININNIENVNWLLNLNPVSFNKRKKDKEGKFTDEFYNELDYGLIAEEVELINDQICFYDETEEGKIIRGVSYTKLIAPMLKAIQELTARVQYLENK